MGKTVASAALLHRYRHLSVGYWKPVQTGIEQDDDTEEAQRLSQCGQERILDAGIRLPVPVSPDLAARLSGVTIDLDTILSIAIAHESERNWIVEGAGGILVPLNDKEMIVDLVDRLALPVVVVSRSGLGTINHTLLTVEALSRRAIAIAGVIMIGPPNAENRRAIEHHGGVPVLGELPLLHPLSLETLGRWADAELDREERLTDFFG